MNSFSESLGISMLTTGISKTWSAPLELWRIQRQNFFIPNSSLRSVLKKEGIRYLWKGNCVNLIKGVPQYSLNYALFQEFNHLIDNRMLAGMASGSSSIAAIYPLETTRTYLYLQTNKNKYKGICDVVRNAPINNLYKGFRISLIGFGLFSGLLFTFQNKIVNYNPNLTPISGGIASIGALTVSYPTDLLRRRMQLQDFDKSVPVYNNYKDLVKKVYASDGARGFYRGLYANYTKSFVQWSIHFYVLTHLEAFWKSNRSS
ncbi:MAG: hypothetical protein CXT73_04765 [Methanobacteriota archaeon]|nr:MAG: hypothetical protein CXT73_04765 [Euryarchaeota archaeon]